MKLSDYVFQFLRERGVDTVFYLPGGGCMHLLDSLGKADIHSVSLLHEPVSYTHLIKCGYYLPKAYEGYDL